VLALTLVCLFIVCDLCRRGDLHKHCSISGSTSSMDPKEIGWLLSLVLTAGMQSSSSCCELGHTYRVSWCNPGAFQLHLERKGHLTRPSTRSCKSRAQMFPRNWKIRVPQIEGSMICSTIISVPIETIRLLETADWNSWQVIAVCAERC
jgi:hypothetical protein